MKKKIFLPVISLLTAILLYSFINLENNKKLKIENSSSFLNHNISDKFIFGAIQSYNDIDYGFSHVDSLEFNVNHSYFLRETNINGRLTPEGLTPNDLITNPVSAYKDAINHLLDSANHHGMINIMNRPKIEWLCNGQRSDYQCEDTSHLENKDLWFYTFVSPIHTGRDTLDNSMWGNNQPVRYCKVSRGDTAGIVVNKLRANTEQSKRGSGWKADDDSKWYVKPRIRIDADFANNNPDSAVCIVYVKDSAGNNKISPKTIKAGHFRKNQNHPYLGQYIEEYYFIDSITPKGITFDSSLGHDFFFAARCNRNENNIPNKADIVIEWAGKCDMWIDYVRVDNDVADQLFKGKWDTTLAEEVRDIAIGTGPKPRILKFYIELAEFNNIPCMSYVNKILKQSSIGQDTVDLMSDITWDYADHVDWDSSRFRVLNAAHIYKNYIQPVGFSQIFSESYPMSANWIDNKDVYSNIPNSLPNNGPLDLERVSPASYDQWLQNNLDSVPFLMQEGGNWTNIAGSYPQLPGYNRFWLKLCSDISAMGNIPFIHMPQAHLWYNKSHGYEVRREPTNEELELLSNISLTYGARGLIYFWFPSLDIDAEYFGRGIAETNGNLRNTNNYGQSNKWQKFKNIGQRTKKWEPYLLSFDNSNRHSYNYKLEKDSIPAKTFINDLKTFKSTDNSDNLDEENSSDRYLQVAVFNNDSADTKYFMIVNRRCSPIVNTYPDGQRKVQIKFNASPAELNHFNNWKIIDLETDTDVLTFDKTVSSFLDLGWFNPGQGKLYKVVPVMKTGGTFVCNEFIENITFNCNGTVHTNGYNLTLNEGVNISFANNVQLDMKKGKFASGISGRTRYITLQGQSGARWYGIKFDSTKINMNLTDIKDITAADSSINTRYALRMIDCDTIKIRTSAIIGDTAGSVNIYYGSGTVSNPLISISYDSLFVVSTLTPAMTIFSNSVKSGTFNIDSNLIKNPSTSGGGVGIYLFNILDINLFSNVIRSFSKSLYTYHSSPDLHSNYITGGVYAGYSYSVLGENHTVFDLSSNAGGFNTITMFSGQCITLDASYFDIHSGGNIFSVYDTLGYHLRGYFPSDSTNTNQDGRGNCFIKHDSEVDSAHTRINVILANSTPVIYRLLNFNCGDAPPDKLFVKKNSEKQNLQNGDPTRSDNRKPDTKAEDSKTNNFPVSKSSIFNDKQTQSLELYTEMKSALRENDYALAADKCRNILELGIEDMYSVDAVRKLFHCIALSKDKSMVKTAPVTKTNEILTDVKIRTGKVTKNSDNRNATKLTKQENANVSSGSVSDLKSYYESYIQTHPSNETIISEMFYFIQKCKINLGDYESALNGYKAIMEKNPSSIAGLSAKWEYYDLKLLINSKSNGKGGGENQLTMSNEQLSSQQEHERLVNLIENFNENLNENLNENYTEDPKDGKPGNKKLTKEDRKIITQNIVNVLESNGTKDKSKLKILKEKVLNNQADANETAEYKKRTLLSELIRTENINNIDEQITMIQNDLRQILALDKSEGSAEIQSKITPVIAFDYKLSQNYPNPFNPSTKINYELKNAGFVSLKIYDLLGREIAELVNMNQDAGRYAIDFNASKYMMASGIYFYRIKAGEFVDTKRMVLVK